MTQSLQVAVRSQASIQVAVRSQPSIHPAAAAYQSNGPQRLQHTASFLTGNHRLTPFSPRFRPKRHQPQLSPRASLSATADSLSRTVVETVLRDPPTVASALWVNTGIFLLAMPVIAAGLSPVGIVSAYLLGTIIWTAFGGQGFAVLAFYFVLGTAATKVRMKQKEAEGIAEKRQGRRGIGSVLGSAAVGVVSAVGVLWGGPNANTALWQLAYVASFCTKFSDTIASEIGKAYGRTTYLVTTLKLVPRGTEGAISLEGTAAGLLAATVMAALALYLQQVDVSGAVICVVASQVANLGESYLGATLQGRSGTEWLTNDLVNIINISLGAVVAVGLRLLLGSA